MAIQHLNEKEAKAKLGEGKVLLNFSASWCGPCKMMAPILEEISEDVSVIKIDIDENKEYAAEMEIQGVPTTIIYQDGVMKERLVGYTPKEVFEQKL